MATNPLVSVIVPTKNSEAFLGACLQSIQNQTYKHLEIIVVDNFSTDGTEQIAKAHGAAYYTQGPERSAQVNYGVEKAKGDYVYKVDSDFTLDTEVVQQCVDTAAQGFDAVVVHNTPDESISWIARIRKFEVDMYKYELTFSSARFVRRDVYRAIGGFNPSITAGEDYDFQNKLNRAGYKTGFIDAEALHHGEPKKILPHMQKFYAYGKDFVNYSQQNAKESGKQLKNPARGVYFKHWRKFAAHPVKGGSFIVYTFFKYAAGGAGLLAGKVTLALK